MAQSKWLKQNEHRNPLFQLQPLEKRPRAYVHQRKFSTRPKNLFLNVFCKTLWQHETNVESLSSDKSWKFKGKCKAAVNLSIPHIHFSQWLPCTVLGYMTSHSASNCLINTSSQVILYLQGNPKSARRYTPRVRRMKRLYILSLLGKVNSTNSQ